MKPLYRYSFTTRIHDIDAAGVVFFARVFYYAHDAYEAFLNHHNLSINKILDSNFLLPISKTNADFKSPFFINTEIYIEIFTQQIDKSEFKLAFNFLDKSGKIKAIVSTTHVCIDKKTHKRIALPNEVLGILST